jgi:hypothetical protein
LFENANPMDTVSLLGRLQVCPIHFIIRTSSLPIGNTLDPLQQTRGRHLVDEGIILTPASQTAVATVRLNSEVHLYKVIGVPPRVGMLGGGDSSVVRLPFDYPPHLGFMRVGL